MTSTSSFPVGHFQGRHILSSQQFTRAELDHLFSIATQMKQIVSTTGGTDLAKGNVLAAIFYEPSTRTSCSFQTAMLRLGGQVIAINDVANSSVSKGETLEDTMRCIECYADVVVLRHPTTGAASQAAKVLTNPLINAGDGIGEHPTQALLDLYTILSELNTIDGLTITMVGDLKNGRTVHSLAKLLTLYNVKLNYVSPDFLRMPREVFDRVAAAGIEQKEYTQLDEVLKDTDVLYVTRVQKERFTDPEEYARAASSYIITSQMLTTLQAKSSLRILHPLPRVNEISTDVDADPRAAYFRQMKCGLYVRMALVAAVLGKV